MIEGLSKVTGELNSHMQGFFWIMLPPFTVFMIVLEFFSLSKNIDVPDIIRRVAVSIVLLLSFEGCLGLLSGVAEGIILKIEDIATTGDLAKHLAEGYREREVSWFRFKDAIIHILGILSYMVAYVGIFVAKTLGQFVWAVLHVCSPLMILMYVSKKTAFVTSSLYKGLINVATWEVLWAILAVLLLKMTTAYEGDNHGFLLTATMNLCIGASMLFIPFTTKSLIGDGLTTAASALSATPTYAVGRTVKNFAVNQAKRLPGRTAAFAKNRFGNLKNVSKGIMRRREQWLQTQRAKREMQKRMNATKRLAYKPPKRSVYKPENKKGEEHG